MFDSIEDNNNTYRSHYSHLVNQRIVWIKKKIIIFMEKFLSTIGLLVLVLIGTFVNAWGYQVFWNEIVLNVWQLFTEADVINTMQISYKVSFVIAVGIGLLWSPKLEEGTDDLAEAFMKVVPIIFTKLIKIGVVLVLTAIVF
jgi:hypothetical protein